MTEIPPPAAPLQPNYASPAFSTAPKKPTSVLVLSVIGIIIGGLSLLCSPMAVIGLVVDFGVPNPQLDAMRRDPMLMAWNWYGVGQMLIFGAWLLVASIAAVTMKKWGRSAMVLYAIVSTTLSIAGWVANFVIVQPRVNASLQGMGMPAQPLWMQAIGWVIGAAMLFYLISIWYVFTRPHILDAYDAAEAAAV
jgi:hypothetical protein